MLFLPAVIVLIVAKQGWLKWIAAGILVLGFVISIETWPYYLIQLAMILGITYGVKWIVLRIRKKTN